LTRCWRFWSERPDHPNRWHEIGYLEAFKRAAELLEKRGVIETLQPMISID
jgi:hypothetical protein